MRGNSTAVPIGALEELMTVAEQRESLTSEEIATIADSDEILAEPTTAWSVGGDPHAVCVASDAGARYRRKA